MIKLKWIQEAATEMSPKTWKYWSIFALSALSSCKLLINYSYSSLQACVLISL